MVEVNVEKVSLGILSKLEVFNVSQKMVREGYRNTYPIKGTTDLIVSNKPLEMETAERIYELIHNRQLLYKEEAKCFSLPVEPFRYDNFWIVFG